MAQHYFDSATSTGVTVGATTTQIVASNSGRRWICICNDSTADMYLSLGEAAVMNKGVLLVPGGTIVIDGDSPFKGVINGICSAGGKNACVSEA